MNQFNEPDNRAEEANPGAQPYAYGLGQTSAGQYRQYAAVGRMGHFPGASNDSDSAPMGQGYEPSATILDEWKTGDTVQRHEWARPFRTSLLAGLGFAVAAVAALLAALLIAILALHLAEHHSSPTVPSGVTSQTCPDGSAPTSQDGGLICDDGSVPQTSGWINQ